VLSNFAEGLKLGFVVAAFDSLEKENAPSEEKQMRLGTPK